MSDVDDSHLRWMLIATVRYSLGRVSGAAEMTTEVVRRYGGRLSTHDRAQMAAEIRDYFRMRPPPPLPGDIEGPWLVLADELK